MNAKIGQTYLLVGGSHDGERIAIPDGETKVVLPMDKPDEIPGDSKNYTKTCVARPEIYLLREFQSGNKFSSILVKANLPQEEWMDHLIAGYVGQWHSIESFDKSKMQFVLVCQDGEVRLRLWNPFRGSGRWERSDGFSEILQPTDSCKEPTHWMECPNPGATKIG